MKECFVYYTAEMPRLLVAVYATRELFIEETLKTNPNYKHVMTRTFDCVDVFYDMDKDILVRYSYIFTRMRE